MIDRVVETQWWWAQGREGESATISHGKVISKKEGKRILDRVRIFMCIG